MDRSKRIIYWTSTLLLAFFIFTGGVAYVLRIQGNVDGFVILGYPIYFMVLIGVWKILGSVVIVVPGLPRLKEWAYAGLFFDVTGAAASHAAVGDYGATGFHVWVNVIFALCVICSWATRPLARVVGEIGAPKLFARQA